MIKNAMIVLLLSATALFSEMPRIYTFVIILDGFRYDYINRGLTPNIDSIIADGVCALSLQPVSPTVSFPNIISSLTGLEASNHEIIANRFMNPYTKQVFNPDDSLNNLDDWLSGETIFKTAKKYGIKTASCYLPLIQKEHSDYFYKYNEKTTSHERIDKALELLKLPYNIRPELVYLFLEEADYAGHKYGTKSEETDKAIMHLDLLIGNIMDSISKYGIKDSANLILYSTHGMVDIISNINPGIDRMVNDTLFHFLNYGSFALLLEKSVERWQFRSLMLSALGSKREFDNYSVSGGLKGIFFPYLLFRANPGFVLSPDSGKSTIGLKALHGYDDYYLDMHGIFCASGVSLKKGIRTGSLNILDIFPLICRIYNFQNYNKSDPEVNRIEYLFEQRKKEKE